MATYSDTVRNARLDTVETTIGTAPILRTYNGTPPADVRTALSGNTLIGQGTLPSDWMANASAPTKALAGSWTLTGQAGAGAGTAATFARIFDSTGTTAHIQCTFGTSFTLNTSALTAANGNVLTFTATTGVAVGQLVSGTGIPAGATVVAFTGTTVTLSHTSTAGVANATTVTFGYEMNANNNNLATGQSATVTSFTITTGN